MLSTVTRQCTMYILAQLLSVHSPDQVQYLFLSSLNAHTPCMAQENDPRRVTHSHIISSWQRGDRWRWGAQSFGDRSSVSFVCWWTVVAGPLLLVEPVCGETQEEQLSEVSRDILSDLECRRRWSKLSHSYNKNSSR